MYEHLHFHIQWDIYYILCSGRNKSISTDIYMIYVVIHSNQTKIEHVSFTISKQCFDEYNLSTGTIDWTLGILKLFECCF